MADRVTTEVEHTDRGWQVALVVDGERRLLDEVHPTREDAELAADAIAGATDRWEDAATVEDDPGSEPHEPG